MELTQKQADVLAFIENIRRTQGGSPTLREIQKHFGFASSFAANRHVMALEKKGALARAGGRARSMVLTKPPLARRIPLLGIVPAGHPDPASGESEGDFLDVDPQVFGLSANAKVFGLRVRGDSMIDAHIVDGDLAIMEDTPARHRDIVAALIDGDVTLKRLIVDGLFHFLKAENARYPDLIPAHELVIQGVLRTVVRTRPI